MSNAAETLKARLRKALKTAMKARRMEEAKLHRAILAAIDNAEAVPLGKRSPIEGTSFAGGAAEVPRRDLSLPELMSLLEDEIIAWRAAAAEFDRLGKPEEAARLRAEAEIVLSYLTD
jgi:uncharacterized protein YqeY